MSALIVIGALALGVLLGFYAFVFIAWLLDFEIVAGEG